MISAIVPLTSDEKKTKRCISSLEQQGDQIEIICVYDSRLGQTIEYKASERVSFVSAQATSYSELCASGLEQAQGEFVAFVRSCDRWMPHFAENCKRGLSKNDVDILVTETIETNSSHKKKAKNISEVKAATNSTRFLFNLFKLGDIPWNKIYRRDVLSVADLRAKPLTEEATGRLLELSGFARARQCVLASRAEYAITIDETRIGDALDADEELPLVLDAIEALDIAASVWEDVGLMDERKTEYLDNTQKIISRAYNFGHEDFFILCKRFHTYFDRHFSRADLDKTKMDPDKALFYKTMDVVGSKKAKNNPGSLAVLMGYAARMNVKTFLRNKSKPKS